MLFVVLICNYQLPYILTAQELSGEWPYMRGGHQLCIDSDDGAYSTITTVIK